MNPFLDFLKKHWKVVLVLLALVLLPFGGFVYGRYTAPKPEVKIMTLHDEKIVKVVDEKLVEQEVSRRVAEIEKTLNTHKVVVVVTKKDGTKVEKTTVDTQSKETSKTEEVKTVEKVVTKTVDVYHVIHDVQKVEIKTPQPAWLVGVEAGTTIESLKGLPPLYVGLTASHRFIGPVFLGASAGVTLDVMTGKPKGAAVMGRALVEF